VALGNGTEVTKETADMVLIDSALKTIVAAIEQGRVIFDNIRKVTAYLLVDSFSEMMLIGSAVLFGLPLPLLPVHILWINLITDGFPNVALTLEPGEPDVMKEPPRPRKEPILNRHMKELIFLIGILTDIGLLGIFLWLLGGHEIEYVRTIMFTAIAIDSLLYVFAIKSFRRSIFHTNPFSNKWLVLGVIAGFALQIMAVTHPFFQGIFEIVPLHLNDWLLLLGIGCVKLVAIEIAKYFLIIKKHAKEKISQPA
jgi:Ca2+-transporting ATPase